MDFSKVNPTFIKYSDDNRLFYFGKPFMFKTDRCIAHTGLEEKDGKFYVIVKITKDLYDFMKRIADMNRIRFGSSIKHYDDTTWMTTEAYYMRLRIPKRYSKFEVNVESKVMPIPTVYDIKPGKELICKVAMPILWNIEDKGLGGCVCHAKEIELL